MKKLKIFPKTFLYTLSLMLIIVLLSHALIYFLMPQAYNYQQKKALESDVAHLSQEILTVPQEKRIDIVTAFAAKWNTNISVTYGGFSYDVNLLQEEIGASPPDGMTEVTIIADSTDDGLKISLAENPYGGIDYFNVTETFAEGAGAVSAIVSRQHIEDAVHVVLMILPVTFVLCVVISILFSLAYSKMFSRPITKIGDAAEQMQGLRPDIICPVDTQDEIGMLAGNVNNLYHTLLSTIHDLEQEIQKVEIADAQKTNFLRAASHELKTPVTAVSAMLENMLLGIGKYKDHATYLAKCKDLTDRLAQMIKEILDATRAEFAGEQQQTEFLVADVLESVLEPYQIIAKSKGLTMNIELGEPHTIYLPKGIIEKVISNILANAVSYTKPNGIITVSCQGHRLVVENECTPIPPEHLAHIFEPFYRPDYGRDRASGGNGLGLYLVATTLKSLDIPFAFTPSKNITGMTFEITF